MGVVEGVLLMAAAGLLFWYAYRAKRRVPPPGWIAKDLGENLLTLLVLVIGAAGFALILRDLLPQSAG